MDAFDKLRPPYCAHRSISPSDLKSEFGFSTMEFHNGSVCELKFFSFGHDGKADMRVTDRFFIKQEHHSMRVREL